MHLPGPLRAAVGLVATAASEARHLPDRAVELPMLVVSTALQASLRAQQRYARLAARGDEVLNRRTPTEEPPPWATFDDPVPLDQLRRSFGSSGDAPADAASFLGQLLGIEDPTAPPDGREPVGEIPPPDEPPVTTPTAAAGRSSATKATGKATTRTTATRKAPSEKTAEKSGSEKPRSAGDKPKAAKAAKPAKKDAGKTVSKPRHTRPSAFDAAGD